MTQPLNILLRPLHLYLWFSGDYAKPRAWCIEEHPVELLKYVWELPSIIADYACVVNPEAVQVRIERLQAFLLRVVRNKHARVLHQLGDVSGLATRGRGHVQDALAWLGCQGRNWQERARTLEDVMTCKVLWGGTYGNIRIVNFEPDLRPFSYGVKIDTSLNKSLGQVLSLSLQSVSSNG